MRRRLKDLDRDRIDEESHYTTSAIVLSTTLFFPLLKIKQVKMDSSKVSFFLLFLLFFVIKSETLPVDGYNSRVNFNRADRIQSSSVFNLGENWNQYNNGGRPHKHFISTTPPFEFGNVSSEEIRRDLCPEAVDLNKIRYDASADKCSQVGQQGHCGENMLFYGLTFNEIYGECDCRYNSPRPLIYHPSSKRCYFLYQQGFCKKGQFLVFNKDGKPDCEFNKCQSHQNFSNTQPSTTQVYVPINGDGPCVLLNRKSEHCQNSEQVVSFAQGELTPKCVKLIAGTRALALARSLRCRPGTYLNIVKKCQPAFTW